MRVHSAKVTTQFLLLNSSRRLRSITTCAHIAMGESDAIIKMLGINDGLLWKRWTFSDSTDFTVCSIHCVYRAKSILGRCFYSWTWWGYTTYSAINLSAEMEVLVIREENVKEILSGLNSGSCGPAALTCNWQLKVANFLKFHRCPWASMVH